MSNYIQFKTAEGEVINVEIEEGKDAGVGRVGIGDSIEKTLTKAQESFGNAFSVISSNAKAFINQISKLDVTPDEVEMSFGIKASGELGNFVVAKATTEANYTIKMVWKHQNSKTTKTKDESK